MRIMLWLVLISACALALAPAAVADWQDDFDSYGLGTGLHGQGGWHGWDGDPTFDAYVTDLYSHSAPQSAEVAGSSDIVQEYSGYSSGQWVYTAWQYIPGNFTGITYFIMLNTYANGGPYNWSVQVEFDAASGLVISDSNLESLPILYDQWVEIRLEIDLDLDIQIFYYGGTMLYQNSWADGMSGGGAMNIAAVDLFANGASPVYYDDMSLLPDIPVPTVETSWGQIKATFK